MAHNAIVACKGPKTQQVGMAECFKHLQAPHRILAQAPFRLAPASCLAASPVFVLFACLLLWVSRSRCAGPPGKCHSE